MDLRFAAENGHHEVLKILLNNKNADPSAVQNYAIRKASENGHHEIVKLLLEDGRANPSDIQNYAIRKASENGHHEIVKLLLEDGRSDPSDVQNYAIRKASENGHDKVVNILFWALQQISDPTKEYEYVTACNYAIRKASENGHVAVLNILLTDKRLDPMSEDNYAIHKASEKGHLEIVIKLFACEPKEYADDPCNITFFKLEDLNFVHRNCYNICFNHVFHSAIENGKDIQQLLNMADCNPSGPDYRNLGRTRFNLEFFAAARIACFYNRTDVLARLFVSDKINHELQRDNLSHITSQIAEKGHLTVLESLIRYGVQIDHDAFFMAARHGQTHILRFLVQHFDGVVHDQNDRAIRDAAFSGNVETFRYLKNLGLDPFKVDVEEEQGIFEMAMNDEHIEMIHELLLPGNGDPTINDSVAIYDACRLGFVEIINTLLIDGRSDPSANNNSCLRDSLEWKDDFETESEFYNLRYQISKILLRAPSVRAKLRTGDDFEYYDENNNILHFLDIWITMVIEYEKYIYEQRTIIYTLQQAIRNPHLVFQIYRMSLTNKEIIDRTLYIGTEKTIIERFIQDVDVFKYVSEGGIEMNRARSTWMERFLSCNEFSITNRRFKFVIWKDVYRIFQLGNAQIYERSNGSVERYEEGMRSLFRQLQTKVSLQGNERIYNDNRLCFG